MSALPRFFFLSALAGLGLWLTGAPYPFPLLGKLIVGCSVVGFFLSVAYVRAFMPAQWQGRTAWLRRVWQSMFRLSTP
ncbi:MAG: hypothetical protein ABI920_00890 [Casimicrobiaceae bacterium]